MRHFCARVARVLAALGGAIAGPLCAIEPATNAPPVEEIVRRVVEHSKWSEAQGFKNQFSFTRRHTTDELTEKGVLKERKERLYEVTPIGGVSHSRLIMKDGKPLTAKEEKKEAEAEKKAWESTSKGLQQPVTPEKGRSVNDDLVARYRFKLEGAEVFNGRAAYVLSFEPRARDLPAKKIEDNFFNKLGGRVWIDQQEYELAKAEVSLIEKVPIVFDFIGAMNKFTIHYRKRRLEENVWLTDRSWVDLETRKLMLHSHVNHLLEWRDFKRVVPAPTNAPPPTFAPVVAKTNSPPATNTAEKTTPEKPVAEKPSSAKP